MTKKQLQFTIDVLKTALTDYELCNVEQVVPFRMKNGLCFYFFMSDLFESYKALDFVEQTIMKALPSQLQKELKATPAHKPWYPGGLKGYEQRIYILRTALSFYSNKQNSA